jgi:hypothetical protein
MSAGGYWKTHSHQIAVYWPDLGANRNFSYWGAVGSWIGQNEKVLNKKSEIDVCKLLREQFPELELVEAKDFSGRCARVIK